MSITTLWIIITLTIVGSHYCDCDHKEKDKESFWEYFKGLFNIFKKDHKEKKHKFDFLKGKEHSFFSSEDGFDTFPIHIPPIEIPIRPYLPPQEHIHHHHHYHHQISPQHGVAPAWRKK